MSNRYFNRVIVTDEKGKPMAWKKDQFYYCAYTDHDDFFPIRSYPVSVANKYIKRANDWRMKRNFSLVQFKTMPFKG